MSKLRVRGSLDFDLHPYSDTWAPAVRALHVASFTMLGLAENAAIAAGRTHLTVRANLNAVPLYAKAGYARLSEGMMPTPTGAELPVVYMERSAA